jgi:phosphoglycerate-specific signal transduction histidine kinase
MEDPLRLGQVLVNFLVKGLELCSAEDVHKWGVLWGQVSLCAPNGG